MKNPGHPLREELFHPELRGCGEESRRGAGRAVELEGADVGFHPGALYDHRGADLAVAEIPKKFPNGSLQVAAFFHEGDLPSHHLGRIKP